MLLALMVWPQLLAQGVSVGLRAGIPVTPMLTANSPQQVWTPRFTIGPLVEVHVWRGAAAGADFLLRRTDLGPSPAGSRRAEVWLWEAPITAVYRFHAPARPFVRTGISFDRVFDIGGANACGRGIFGEQFYCLEGSYIAEVRHRGTVGVVAGGGLEFRAGRLRLEPELRVTHWNDRNIGVRGSAVRSNLNQAAFLIGIIF